MPKVVLKLFAGVILVNKKILNIFAGVKGAV